MAMHPGVKRITGGRMRRCHSVTEPSSFAATMPSEHALAGS